jgi:hypothetical protein
MTNAKICVGTRYQVNIEASECTTMIVQNTRDVLQQLGLSDRSELHVKKKNVLRIASLLYEIVDKNASDGSP